MQKTEGNLDFSPRNDQTKARKAFRGRKYLKIAQNNQSSQDEFQPLFHTMKKLKLPINKKRLSLGIWSSYQNSVYLKFLKNNKMNFQTQISRREERVFCKLSDSLGKKRTPDQCRSHHNKLLSRHRSDIDAIINQLQKKIVLNELKQEPSVKARQIDKQIDPKSHTQSDDFRSTSSINCPNESLQLQNSKGDSQSKEKIMPPFYKMTICKSSCRIIIEINEASIQSY